MKLEQLESQIISEKGAPYLERCRKLDKGQNTWGKCFNCRTYTVLVDNKYCRKCKLPPRKRINSLGTIGDVWPK